MNDKSSYDSFSIIGLLAIVPIVFLIFYTQQFYIGKFNQIGSNVANLMLMYIVFIIFRNVLLLLLTFVSFFVTKKKVFNKNYPLVSIIIPCFNEEKVILQSIDSVLEINYPNVEIILVDDGSNDTTLTLAKENIKGKIRIIYQRNNGKASALNRGISESLGKYILACDADSKLSPDVLELAIPILEGDKQIAAVAGKVVIGSFNYNLLTHFQRLEYIVGLNFHKTAQSFLSMVTIIPGPIGVFRKSLIEKIGGYHEDCFAEDSDLTIRLLIKGYKTVYEPKMIATTEAPRDLFQLFSQRYRWSRGVLQAIKLNSSWLLKPFSSFRNFFIMWYILVETLLIPVVNFLFFAVSLYYALNYRVNAMLGIFFIQLTLLDITTTLYNTFFEKGRIQLIFLASINRLTYGLALEILRFFSIIDELLGLPMKWGKLKRNGL